MRQPAVNAAHLDVVADTDRWRELARRRERNGIDINELADIIHMSREQLGRILRGEVPKTRALGKIERALDELEAEAGRGPLVPEQVSQDPRLFRIRLSGVYGVAEVLFEGPVEDADEVRRQADLLLRGQHENNQVPEPSPPKG